MLRTNLATRPFYNERLVALIVGALALLVAIATVANVVALVALSGRDAALRQQADDHAAKAAELRREALQARARVNRDELAALSAAAREANALIDGRTFSWTGLFNRLDDTLPGGVRITGIRPVRDEQGRFTVGIDIQARDVDEVEAFMEALETRGGFRDVLARREQVDAEGLIEVGLTGVYQPTTAVPAAGGGR